MKFNNSKKAVLKRKELKQYSDKKIEDIVYSIKITPIFDYDIQIAHELINECFQDLQINKNMYNAAMYLEQIGMYLDCEKLDKLLNEEYIVSFARKETDEKIKGFYEDGDLLLAIAKEYAPFVRNKQELPIFMSQIQYDAYSKMYLLSRQYVWEQINVIYESYKELRGLQIELIHEIKRVFKLDKEKLLKENAEGFLNHVEGFQYICSFREMEKIAIDNGYTLDRVTGSHHIYKRGSKTISIPKHSKDLGKGLSIKIQKDIRKNNEE